MAVAPGATTGCDGSSFVMRLGWLRAVVPWSRHSYYGASMAGSVARLPGSTNGDDGVPPADVYRIAVEEYRFQAQHNWSRTQYLLGFNVAILAAGAAVAARPGPAAALVFLLGVVAAALSAVVVRTQHDYYRAARERVRRVENAVGVPSGQRLDTTATLGGRKRLVSVNQVVYLLLGAMAVGDTAGGVLVLLR